MHLPPRSAPSTPNSERLRRAVEELQVPACIALARPGPRKGAQHGRARDLAGSPRLQKGRGKAQRASGQEPAPRGRFRAWLMFNFQVGEPWRTFVQVAGARCSPGVPGRRGLSPSARPGLVRPARAPGCCSRAPLRPSQPHSAAGSSWRCSGGSFPDRGRTLRSVQPPCRLQGCSPRREGEFP